MFATHIQRRHSSGKWREIPSFTVGHVNIHSRLCCQVFGRCICCSFNMFRQVLIQIRALVQGWRRHRHFAGKFHRLNEHAFLGFRALTSSNRIQLVRKLIVMPPMLLEPSNKALKIKTHKNVLVFLRMLCIAFVLNRIYQRRSWNLHNHKEDAFLEQMPSNKASNRKTHKLFLFTCEWYALHFCFEHNIPMAKLEFTSWKRGCIFSA